MGQCFGYDNRLGEKMNKTQAEKIVDDCLYGKFGTSAEEMIKALVTFYPNLVRKVINKSNAYENKLGCSK